MKKAGTIELQQIDAAIEQEQATKTTLEEKLAAAINEHVEAQARRDELAYSALVGDDHKLKQKLTSSEEAVLKAEQRIASTKKALISAEMKLTQLQQHKAEQFRKEKLDEYQEACNALIRVGNEKIENALGGLIAAKAEADVLLRTMDACASAAGIEKPLHVHLTKNLRHSINHRLKISPIWLSAEARKMFSMPVGELFRHVLSSVQIDKDAVKKAAND